MTAPFLRKRRISLVPLLTALAALPAIAQAQAPVEPQKLPTAIEKPHNVDDALRRVREHSNQILRTQAVSDDVRMKRGTGAVIGDDNDYFFEVETKPPTRERLFTLGSEGAVFRGIEEDFRQRDPTQMFLLPAPLDLFKGPDNPTLGPMWYQNRVSGRGQDTSEVRGDMRVANETGVYPVGSNPEAAIMNQSVGSADLQVSVHIKLGNPKSKFGLVFRAQDPDTWVDNVDQIKVNSFYYAVASADTLTLGKMVGGKDTVLKTVSIPPKTDFKLGVTVYADQIDLFRDGAHLLRVSDTALEGEFVGLIGLSSIGAPVHFDNFLSIRYGGPFVPRSFGPSASVFRGANVHYQPLYFEQVALERYGHHLGNPFQPFIAHGSFFVDLLGLPYSIGKSPPWECHSGEGYCKPGDIVLPFRVCLPPCDKKGIVLQTAVTALAFSLIP